MRCFEHATSNRESEVGRNFQMDYDCVNTTVPAAIDTGWHRIFSSVIRN
jgi:hypothetical protein